MSSNHGGVALASIQGSTSGSGKAVPVDALGDGIHQNCLRRFAMRLAFSAAVPAVVAAVLLTLAVAPASAQSAKECIRVETDAHKFRNVCSKNVVVAWCISEPDEGVNVEHSIVCGNSSSYYGWWETLPEGSSTPVPSGGWAGSVGRHASGRRHRWRLAAGSAMCVERATGPRRGARLPSPKRMFPIGKPSGGLPRSCAPTTGVRWSATAVGAPRVKRSRVTSSMQREITCGGTVASPDRSGALTLATGWVRADVLDRGCTVSNKDEAQGAHPTFC